ncbi:anaphase-promoting complex subunit 1-like isoform X2 [Ylistrum balloti]|uniref:anaphase-promoting complex subunit 1-like isoform X2 n=1 Tax=Ylistrum balloti TaxID=509963 RepID=UPI002905F35D|nr:anaphase-promoting complex subunit 1-like isoform X2 [Ylistrum balloti]
MIAACFTQDFVPFGREYSRRHPGTFQLQVQNTVSAEHGVPLLKSFRDISIQEHNKKEQWLFHQIPHEVNQDLCDEELYFSGNTVVWSKGGQNGTRSIVKTFTVDTPVVQALWSNFILPASGIPEDIAGFSPQGELQSGVCVVESGSISFFIEKGGEYNIALPFQVASTWMIENGLLFERTVSPTEIATGKRNSPSQTTVFSMLHPLDEVAPVITKTSSPGSCPKISYLTDNTQHIIFTSVEPSLVFTYDTMVGVHSAWRVRKARLDECNTVCGLMENSFYHPAAMATPMGMNQSSSSHSRFIGSLSAQSPSISPMRSFSGRVSSPGIIPGRSQSLSPAVGSMAAVSRSQSPAMGLNSMHRLLSPSPSVARSPGNYFRTPPVGSHNVSLINESYTDWVEPLKPEVCFEHLWTEPAPAIRDGSLGKSSKAFLTRDLCGQQYLCYVISYRQQLRCVKFEESNDLSQLIFGTVAVIPAKDAVPIESLDLLVLLDPTGGLWVYSGTTKINRLHVPTLPLGSGSLSMLRTTTPINSPSRGGYFTSSRPPSAMEAGFDEEMTQMSPVPTELEDSSQFDEFPVQSSFIQGIKDNVGARFTIELMNNHLCRTTMPAITSSPGIEMCLQALKHMLPKDLAISILGKWYTMRNTPGGLGNQSEWSLFSKCLLSMMGYDTTRLALTNQHELDTSMSPVVAVKRPKQSDQGSDDDWEGLLSSTHHQYTIQCMEPVLGLTHCTAIPDASSYSKPCAINTNATLFPHIPAVMMGLHLVYEEMKLNTLLTEDVEKLVPILYQIASDLKCSNYTDYYCRDFQQLFDAVDDVSQITEDHLHKMVYPGVFTQFVPSVLQWLQSNLRGDDPGSLPYIPGVCNNIKNVISLYALLLKRDLATEQAIDKCLRRVAPAGHRAPTCDLSMSRSFSRSFSICVPSASVPERIVLYMTEIGMTYQDLEYLPVGVSLPLREAIFHCRCNAPSDWTEQAYTLIGRQDLSQLLGMENKKPQAPPGIYTKQPHPQSKRSKDEEDGMEHMDEELLRLRFSDDLRVQEVRRLLQSSRPARIALVQRPEVSDHDFIEEQEKHLYSICIRTMALPVGRGMFTLSTYHPLPTEAIPIPKLCLTGKAPPRNATVDLTHIDTPANMSAWPQFHNGVAAGLRIANSSQVDTTWIIYNKPKSNEFTNEYAGFLMALGLNGHLNLNTLNIHDYLSKGHEMITVGLLLGMAAAKRGTMDLATMKLLSIHVPALLPPTSTELNVPHNVQVAGVLGVGLVYQGTAHRHTAEVLLSEIGRPPGPEMENCNDRESYSLAAGMALGLVMFGRGSEIVGTPDLSMADTLYHFMVGGHKRPLSGPNKERYKSPSCQIKEGDSVNVDVTSPGATLALGMLYFKTNNSAVAEWLIASDTQFMLDHVRPDFLMLRTLSRGLVMWDSVIPTFQWLTGNLPPIIQKYAFTQGQVQDDDTPVDFETMSQAYCNIVGGGCMVIGLKFAGTANKQAFDTLKECMRMSLEIVSCPSHVEQAGKITVENTMMSILLALAMVMSGTGNLEILRMCRMLRARVGPHSLGVMYGSHMAISMSLGLLFLGGGRYSLKTTADSIAVMLCAFYPKFPIHSNDNRYHLQALRHLYVMAADPRLVLPRDVDTGHPCYVPMEVKFKDTDVYRNVSFSTSAPCLLPELDIIEEVKITGPRYWPITFHLNKNWNNLQLVLQNNGTLYVKQRAGHLSYVEDPKGYRSMLAKSLTSDHSSHSSVKPDVVKAFTSDPRLLALTEYFLNTKNMKDVDFLQILSSIVYECVTKEKPESIPSYVDLHQSLDRTQFGKRTGGVCQLKLVLSYYGSRFCLGGREETSEQLMKLEFLMALKSKLENILDRWQTDNMDLLVKYLQGEVLKGQETSHLSAYLCWFEIPTPTQISKVIVEGAPTLPVLCANLPQLSVGTVMRILTAWQAAV